MISNHCIEVQTFSDDRPSVPEWFAEVVIMVHYLATKGLLDAFAHQVRLVRGRFGNYEPIDFLALLIGYAISGERTLVAFFERLAPFGSAFMALFSRTCFPHRSSLSCFLADGDRPCLEAFRALFEQHCFAEEWTAETIGGIFDRQGRRFIVFDVDATRQAARQRALPSTPELPSPRRRLDAVCAPCDIGSQARGGGTNTNHGPIRCIPVNGSARMGIEAMATIKVNWLRCLSPSRPSFSHFAFTPEVALVRKVD
jgi:hypothetical protein